MFYEKAKGKHCSVNKIILFFKLLCLFRVCSSNTICRTLNCGDCGICNWNKNLKKEYCETSYLNQIFNTDCTLKNTCTLSPCLNGICKSKFGNYVCLCKNPYYGNKCENRSNTKSEDYASGLTVAYLPIDNVLKDIKILVSLDNFGNEFYLLFENGAGDNTFYNIEAFRKGRIEKICNEVIGYKKACMKISKSEESHYLIIKTAYPYFTKGKGVIKQSGEDEKDVQIIGNYVHFTIAIYNVHDLVLEQTFPHIVNYRFYKDDNCIPIVQISNCDSNIIRKRTRTIRSIVKPNKNCQDRKDIVLKWNIYTYGTNFDKEKNVLPREEKLREFVIPQFSLDVGMYKLMLVATTTFVKHNSPHTYYNFATCIIEIEKINLIAVIKGGISRNVYSKDNIILDGSKSSDPNEPLSNQGHLKYSWTCDKEKPFCKIFTKSQYTIKGPFPAGDKYTFQLSVTAEGMDTKSAFQVISIVGNKIMDIEIICVKNCGNENPQSNPREIIYFRVEAENDDITASKDVQYSWTYTENSGPETSTDSIKEIGTPSNILIIKANSLTEGSTYNFNVQVEESKSSVEVIMATSPVGGSCTIRPNTGTAATTLFTIICQGFTSTIDITGLNYEFFETSSGAFLGFSFIGELNEVVLSRNYITVRISNSYGMYVEKNISVQVNPLAASPENIQNLINNVNKLVQYGDSAGTIRLISAISDVIMQLENNLETIKILLDILSKEHINDFSDIKMYSLVLKKLVTQNNQVQSNGLDSDSCKVIAAIMRKLSKKIVGEIVNKYNVPTEITTQELQTVTRVLLETGDVVLSSRDPVMFNESAGALQMFAAYKNYEMATSDIISTIENLGKSIGHTLLQLQPEVVIQSNKSTLWIKYDTPERLYNMTRIPLSGNSFVSISKILMKALKEKTDVIRLEFAALHENPYWWDYNEKNLESEVISLRLFERISDKMVRMRSIPEYIDIFLKLKSFKSQVISGSVTMPALVETDDEKDNAVSIHRLDAPVNGGSGKVVIQFRNLKPNDTLKVLVMENMRPDYDFVNKKGSIITNDSSSYGALFLNESPDVFLYIGLIPSSEVLPGVTIDYTFEMYSIQCQTRSGREWNSKICKVGSLSTHDLIHCQCTHLSVFGGSILIAPNKLDPIRDIRLFLTVPDNPAVFILVVTLLLLYVSTLIWAYYRDRRDELQKIVIVLDDNYPGEKWGYLLTVFTGSRLYAGTSANVGFEIFGKLANSRAHVFRSKKRKVLQKGCDDWFLIFTPKHLGELQTLHIWHDNSGPYPDWYCVKIIVHDLTFNKEYSFLVESWFCIGKYGKYVEAMLKPSLPTETTHFNRLFTTNAVYYFREAHLWMGIFLCHPRTCLTRTHRVSIATSLIMCSLLTSIMFYGVAADVGVDEASYSLKTREIIIAIESALITTPVTFLIVFFFRKSRIVKQVKNQSDGEQLNEKDFVTKMNENDPDANSQPKKKGSCIKKVCEGLSFIVLKVIFPKPLIPVKNFNTPTTAVIERPKFALIGWIICQTCIWGSAFFIMLYGLKLGKITSELWMTATLIRIGQGIFISSPIKLCVYSFILTLAFQKSYNVTTFDVNVTDAMRLDLVGNKEFLTSMIELRSQPEYYPLSRLTLIDMHKGKIAANLVWGPLMKLITILIFTVILLMAGGNTLSAQFYSNNIHIKTMLTEPMTPGAIGFKAVLNITRFGDYLLSTLIPALYTSKWYNKSPLSSEAEKHFSNEWTNDANTRLLSIPRLRQIRISPDACNIPYVMKDLNITCASALSDTTEDTIDYDTQWRQRFNFSKSSAWIYRPRSDASNYFYGLSGHSYHDGGYIAKFGLNHKETNIIVSQLIDNRWFDHLTRVIFLELTLYNINTKVISIATITAEYLPSGAFFPTIQVVSSTSVKFQNEVWFLILVFFQVLFAIQIIFKITGFGLSQLFLSFWNIFELCICILCFVCLIMHIIQLVSVSHIFRTLQTREKEEHLDISLITVYNQRMNFILFALILLSTVWVLRYSMLCNTIKTFYYTLKLSFPLMIWLILILLLFLIYVGSILCAIFNSLIFTNFSIMLLYRMSYSGISSEKNVLQQKNIKILYCFTCAAGYVFFLIIITYYYRLGKYYKYDLTKFNIYDSIIKNKLKYLKPRSKHKGFRLRGGSDKSCDQQNVKKRSLPLNLHEAKFKLMTSIVSNFLPNQNKLTLIHSNPKHNMFGNVLFKDIISHNCILANTNKHNITEKLPYNTTSQYNSYYFDWMIVKLDCIIDKLEDIEDICDSEYEQDE